MAEEFDFAEDESLDNSLDFDDEFDRLRQKTARASAVYDDMEYEELEEEVGGRGGGFLGQFSPQQRLILAVLLLLDILVIGLGALVIFKII